MYLCTKGTFLACLFVGLALGIGSLAWEGRAMATEPDYAKALRKIDDGIKALSRDYPQLADYPKTRNLSVEGLVISYEFHTHQPKRRPGWAGAVPNPDDDGIWFHIDLHDPDSTAQIHTQPVVTTQIELGKKLAFLLLLEGGKTKPVADRIWDIIVRVARKAGGGPPKSVKQEAAPGR
jgi:hypothetical protein